MSTTAAHFIAVQHSIVRKYDNFKIHLLVGYLGDFQFWAIMNKAAMKMSGTSIWVDLCHYVSSKYWAGFLPWVKNVSIYKELRTLFQSNGTISYCSQKFKQRERERVRQCSHQLVYFLDNHNSQGGPKSGARNTIQVARRQSVELEVLPPRICISWKLESRSTGENQTQALQYGTQAS